MAKLTVRDLLDAKGKRKLACTTAHDYHTAMACEQAGIDMIVTSGAFLRQYIAGDTTTSGTMADLKTVLEGVRKGAPNTFVYVALPLSVASVSDESALGAAMRALDWGADGIYYSGMSFARIAALRREMVPVFGHAGMVPWHKSWYGGCRAVGKTAQEALWVYDQARNMQDAGCVAIELECVPQAVAAAIAQRLRIPVLSMGSGDGCDGQYLFSQDLLGIHRGHYPRHCLNYVDQFGQSVDALARYAQSVKGDWSGTGQKLVAMTQEQWQAFVQLLDAKEDGHGQESCGP